MQISAKDENFQKMANQTAGWSTMAPCMQASVIDESFYPNQISHGIRASGASGQMGRSTMYAHVLKSQQPTESSKAKEVAKRQKEQKEQASYSMQV